MSLEETLKDVADDPEMAAEFESKFKTFDIDSDGFLSIGELSGFLGSLEEEDGKRTDEVDEAEAGEEAGAQSVMDEMDTDKDGKMSLEETLKDVADDPEMAAEFESKFKTFDIDSDGFLSIGELSGFLGSL